jgi:hypothetical protein
MTHAMLDKKHPRKRRIPPVQLSLRQFKEFCEKMLGNLSPGTEYEIEFQGTDGSDITTSAVDNIACDDDTVPNVILMPTVTAHAVSGDSIELRRESAPAVGGSPPYTTYVLAATGSTQVWADGVMHATMQWFERKRTPVFRLYGYIQGVLMAVAVAALVVATVAFLGTGESAHAQRNLYVAVPALLASVAFFVAFQNFPKYYPAFSVVVHERPRTLTWLNASVVLGAVASVFAIAQGVGWLIHH